MGLAVAFFTQPQNKDGQQRQRHRQPQPGNAVQGPKAKSAGCCQLNVTAAKRPRFCDCREQQHQPGSQPAQNTRPKIPAGCQRGNQCNTQWNPRRNRHGAQINDRCGKQ
ncbi:hypothetical protein SDC9_206762 [bioreactor metagenome]|uniref:Uncharacterized protein n=1 Tax=bioreactor metagenome TaxID=1076179 RepID=A0A645JFC5_9ZZZZ